MEGSNKLWGGDHDILYAVPLIYSHRALALILTHLYLRASSCHLFFSCRAGVRAAAFLHSCEIGMRTQQHLSPAQTRRRRHQPAQKLCHAVNEG